MGCPRLVTCDGMHQNLIIWFWVKQMYGICFFNVALMSIATLLEMHFRKATVSADSHSQDTIRTNTTFHQLWLYNTSVCLCWFTDEWEHVTWCGTSAILSNPQNVTSYPRTCGIIIIYINDVSLYMSTFSSAVCLANQRWITAWTHSFIHICGTVTILELVLFMHMCCHICTNHLWCTVTAHMIYIFSCNSSPIK